ACPALCRASTSSYASPNKTWVAGTSPAMTEALLRQKRLDLLALLRDGEDAVEMAVRPRQLRNIDLGAAGGDRLRRRLHVRRIEDEIVRRIEDQGGRLDLRRVGVGELVRLDQIEQRIGVRRRRARRRDRVECGLDLVPVVERLGR